MTEENKSKVETTLKVLHDELNTLKKKFLPIKQKFLIDKIDFRFEPSTDNKSDLRTLILDN